MTQQETITQMIQLGKLDAPEFDGRLESTAFLNWLDKMVSILNGTTYLTLNVLVWLGLS